MRQCLIFFGGGVFGCGGMVGGMDGRVGDGDGDNVR